MSTAYDAPALIVRGIAKAYPSYGSSLARFARWFGMSVRPQSEYWAVRDVSLSLRAGESFGIIGPNGSGKSTLLKLITGTVRPTHGTVTFAGRLSAMLELGLGFNPELTGRQNVLLSGGLMGLSVDRLTELLPGIERFAELGDFFDKPLRVYSSGMHARLAFAVATAVRPEILIVDEILSVGDSYFQHKSFNRIRAFKADGTSLLFVSHNMNDVRELCERVILLDNGAVLCDGAPDEVVDYYNAMVAKKESETLTIEQKRRKDGWLVTASGTEEVSIRGVALTDAQTGQPISTVQVGQEVVVTVTVQANLDVPSLVVGFMIKDRTGHIVWGSNTWHTRQVVKSVCHGSKLAFKLRFSAALGPGSYSVTCAAHASDTHIGGNFHWIDNIIVFDVVNTDHPRFIGTSHLPARFEIVQ